MILGMVRRKIHQAHFDGKKYRGLDLQKADSLNEPLLENYSYDGCLSESYGQCNRHYMLEEHKKVHLLWTFLSSNLIAQWAKWLADIVFKSGSLLGRLLSLHSMGQNSQDMKGFQFSCSPLQEERLRKLQRRLEVPFDGTRVDHQCALQRLWQLAYPNRELPSLRSDLWKEMGWQGPDPSTDFRGGGFLSLENLIFFAERYPDAFQKLLHKNDGVRSEWEYPFAVAGINITFMLAQMLDLQSGVPSSTAAVHFLEVAGKDEMAFDILFCVAFLMMDAQWLAMQASYMDFNEVIRSTRVQLERELCLEDISSITDLPAYNLLRKL